MTKASRDLLKYTITGNSFWDIYILYLMGVNEIEAVQKVLKTGKLLISLLSETYCLLCDTLFNNIL